MRVYVKEQPRSLALATDEHVLIFRYFEGGSGNGNQPTTTQEPKCIVEFARRESIEFQEYTPLSNRECHGFLGIINIHRDVFLCSIIRRSQAASPKPGESIFRIYGVEFHCLTRPDWDFVTLDNNGYPVEGLPPGAVTPGYYDESASSSRTNILNMEHPCTNIRKLLGNGSFYYSTDFDLTCVLQNR
jgi:hypothetical protein